MDLLIYINTCPPGTPINEWNKNRPCYVLTGGTQGYKTFTDLPKDLPCAYGSLTVSRKSFRSWLGPKNTSTFHVPGMEFFATTGVYKNETECRNPAGTWLRKIIPKGDQIPKFLDEVEKICNHLNEDIPGYDYHNELDSIDGRITLSYKGVHFASTLYYSSGNGGVPFGFEEDVLNTDLTKAITQEFQSTATAGKAAGQVAPTEELAFCDFLNTQTHAPDIPALKVEEKATCFQRATDSKESINDPAAAESSPWRPASLPFTFFDTHYKFLVFHRALLFCGTQLLYRPYPRPRIYARCAHIRKSFWLPSTPKLKLPTIRLKF